MQKPLIHGTLYTYTYHRCHCNFCKKARSLRYKILEKPYRKIFKTRKKSKIGIEPVVLMHQTINFDKVFQLKKLFAKRTHVIDRYENHKFIKLVIMIEDLTENISDDDWIIISKDFIKSNCKKIMLNTITTTNNNARRMLTFEK